MNIKSVFKNIRGIFKIIKRDHEGIYIPVFFQSITEAIFPYLNLIFFARVIGKCMVRNYKSAFYEAVFMMILNLCLKLINSWCKKSLDTIKEVCQDNIEKQCAEKMFKIKFQQFENKETMDVLLQNELDVISSGGIMYLISNLVEILKNLWIMILGIFFMGSLLFITPHAAIIIFVIYAFILRLFYDKLLKYYDTIISCLKKNEENCGKTNSLLDETMQEEWDMYNRIYKMENYYKNKFGKNINEFKDVCNSIGNVQGRISGMLAILAKISSIVMYVFTGIRAMIYGDMNLGHVILYGGVISQITYGFSEFFMSIGHAIHISNRFEKYVELINRDDMETQGSIPVEKRNDYNYEFQFQNVGFHYPGENTMVLKDINIKFKIGEKLALVGLNGAGKTTLIKLLCRLYEPTEGVILLNGIDINKYDFNEYVSLFSVVFQDFQLFSLDLYENVSGDSTPDGEKVKQCLKKVGMDRVKNHRLNNDNGEGINLSQGEQQKLAIARALYKDSAFVILDEPTASLDPLAEAEVYESFDTLVENKSTIYISHRMSSCKFCNNIVVLEGGRITECGNHEELMKLKGTYATMFNTQAEYYRENKGRDCFGN